MNENLGFNQGLKDGVSLSALGAPGGQLCGEILIWWWLWLSLRCLTRHCRADVKKSVR